MKGNTEAHTLYNNSNPRVSCSRANQLAELSFAAGFYSLSSNVRSIRSRQSFLMECWFHLQGYINTQSNHYWSSQNPHLTHEVPLHSLNVGVWCFVSARRIVVPVFSNETINCERYVQVIFRQFFPELTTAHTVRMFM
jgi:hypothetical protein